MFLDYLIIKEAWLSMAPARLPSKPPPMHDASKRLRAVLVLNELMEFQMRRHMHINETDFQAMQHLRQHRSMSPGDLARSLHLTSAATTTVIDRLVVAGHARRVPHATDRRRWLIEPTQESIRDAMSQLMPMVVEADNMVRSLPQEHQDAVVTYLDGVIDAIQRRIVEMDGESTNGPSPATPGGAP